MDCLLEGKGSLAQPIGDVPNVIVFDVFPFQRLSLSSTILDDGVLLSVSPSEIIPDALFGLPF